MSCPETQWARFRRSSSAVEHTINPSGQVRGDLLKTAIVANSLVAFWGGGQPRELGRDHVGPLLT